MTCIVALEHDKKVFMGGDSAAAAGWDMRLVTTPKVFRKGDLVVGYTWSFRMGQIIQYASSLPELSEHPSNYAYLVEKFVPFIRKTFSEAGWLKTENARDEGGQFLIGIRGEVFSIETDFSVLRNIDGFSAIGCGAAYALGALQIMNLHGEIAGNPMLAVSQALEVGAYFSNGVSGPFVYEVQWRRGNEA